MIDPEKKVIFDADVLIHFIKGELLFSIPRILDNELIILDKVYNEIIHRNQKNIIDRFVKQPKVKLIDFPDREDYIKEYAHLMSPMGYDLDSGESACLAYAKFNKDILASSNLRDIKKYCSFHDIEYLTTIDLLKVGYENDFFTEKDCDEFIQTVRRKGSNLPDRRFKDL